MSRRGQIKTEHLEKRRWLPRIYLVIVVTAAVGAVWLLTPAFWGTVLNPVGSAVVA